MSDKCQWCSNPIQKAEDAVDIPTKVTLVLLHTNCQAAFEAGKRIQEMTCPECHGEGTDDSGRAIYECRACPGCKGTGKRGALDGRV